MTQTKTTKKKMKENPTGPTSTKTKAADDPLSDVLGPGNFRSIARRSGISRGHVSNVLRGKARPSVDILDRISAATSIPYDDIRRYIKDYDESRNLPDTRDPNRSSTLPVSNPQSLGARIRRAREAQGWTQQELADRLEVHSTYVSKIEHGRRVPDWPVLQRISTYCDHT